MMLDIEYSQRDSTFIIQEDDDEDIEVLFGSFRGDVVGIRYYSGIVNNNEMVSLRREPQNKYDRNAIRVDNVLGQQVGHIKREQAAALASLIDKNLAKVEGIIPFGSKNKFSMPCDITLRGNASEMKRCEDLMIMKGYRLKSTKEGYSDGGVWREMWNGQTSSSQAAWRQKFIQRRPSVPQYAARTSSTKELKKVSRDRLEEALETLFDNTNKKEKLKPIKPCECVKIPLYDHQIDALSWMVHRENQEQLPPFWEKRGTYYYHLITSFSTKQKPKTVQGGILADDMGLGKTLSIISLIVTNYRNGKPLVMVDKSKTKECEVKSDKKIGEKKERIMKRKFKEPILIEIEDDEVDEEPPLLSFSAKDDVDYIMPSTSQQQPIHTIASKKERRSSSKKPRYNFDSDEDWTFVENERSPAEKQLVNTPKGQMTSHVVNKVVFPGARATLIVCPLSVLSNWQDQLNAHLEVGSLDVYTYHGSDRNQNINFLTSKDVVLTTYQTLSSDFSKFKKGQTLSALHNVDWLRIVLDEGHCIRNVTSKQSKACLVLRGERRWVVSGTPLQNSVKDLWSLMCFLRVEPFDKEKEWWNRTVERPITQGQPNGFKQLQGLMHTLSMRRTKDHKVGEIPVVKLPEKNIFVQTIELSEEERKLYQTFKTEGHSMFQSYVTAGTINDYANMLVILMRLRQLCCHPKLCTQTLDLVGASSSNTPDNLREKLQQILSVLLSSGSEDCPICLDSLDKPVITHCAHLYCKQCIEDVIHADKPKCPICRGEISIDQLVEPSVDDASTDQTSQQQATWSSSSKVDGFITLLNQERTENRHRKHLVVSQFVSFLNLLEKPLTESGFKFVRLDGSLSMRQRKDVITLFSDKTLGTPTVLLLSLKAGGVGINLTVATRVFLMDPAWNPSAEEQCFDRCHRLGQTEEVKIYKFVVKDSVEERMVMLQNQKRALLAKAFSKKVTEKEKQEKRISFFKLLLE